MQEMIVYYGVLYLVPPIQPNSQGKKPHKIRDFWVSECQKRAGSTPKLQKITPIMTIIGAKFYAFLNLTPKNSISPCSHIFNFCTGVLLLRRRYKKSLGRE